MWTSRWRTRTISGHGYARPVPKPAILSGTKRRVFRIQDPCRCLALDLLPSYLMILFVGFCGPGLPVFERHTLTWFVGYLGLKSGSGNAPKRRIWRSCHGSTGKRSMWGRLHVTLRVGAWQACRSVSDIIVYCSVLSQNSISPDLNYSNPGVELLLGHLLSSSLPWSAEMSSLVW